VAGRDFFMEWPTPGSTRAEGERTIPVHILAGGLPPASPMIISEMPTQIIVAVEMVKATLGRHRRFIEMLLHTVTRSVIPDE
jgi:hypothetical protein